MATFVLIHGAAESGANWHLVSRELRDQGHDAIAPDLPCEDDTAGFPEYAGAVIDAIGDRTDLILVGHSLGGYTATLVADRLPVQGLVLVTAMIPAPGEPANDWWQNSGYPSSEQDDSGANEPMTEMDRYYHDVPPELATGDQQLARGQSGAPMTAPWPLTEWPDVPTRFILCTEDRLFPPSFMQRVIAERLPGVVPEEIATGHMPMLARPTELADLLDRYAGELSTPGVVS